MGLTGADGLVVEVVEGVVLRMVLVVAVVVMVDVVVVVVDEVMSSSGMFGLVTRVTHDGCVVGTNQGGASLDGVDAAVVDANDKIR